MDSTPGLLIVPVDALAEALGSTADRLRPVLDAGVRLGLLAVLARSGRCADVVLPSRSARRQGLDRDAAGRWEVACGPGDRVPARPVAADSEAGDDPDDCWAIYAHADPRQPTPLAGLVAEAESVELEEDREALQKQRHTAVRIFERLRDEHGYPGGLTLVKTAVAAWRRHSAVFFVPLANRPGKAQAVALVVMTLPYSDANFVCAFPRECTEAFLEGHTRAFEVFGGVPRRISYDNSKIAVARIVGSRKRKVTDAFLRLESHHLSEDHSRLVRRPIEKGHVETLIGHARRGFLVPVPVVNGGLEPLNAHLERRCREDLTRRLWGEPACGQGRVARRGAILPAAPAG